MGPLAIIALSSVALASPPMQIDWATADVVIGGDGPGVERRCGIEETEVFVVLATQTATDGMSREEREAYDALVERFAAEYDDADQRGRAILGLELLKASTDRQRIVNRGWIVLDGMPVSITWVYDGVTGGVLFEIKDEVTGAFVSHTLLQRSQDDFEANRDLIKDMLATDDEEKKHAIIDELSRQSGGGQAIFEVNGVTTVLNTSDPAFLLASMTAFTDLWPNLAPEEGRERIELAVPIVWAMIKDQGTFAAVSAGRILPDSVYPDSLGHDACVLAAGVEFVAGRTSGNSLTHVEPPPDDLVEAFFGDEGLPLPDPDLSWKELVKELR